MNIEAAQILDAKPQAPPIPPANDVSIKSEGVGTDAPPPTSQAKPDDRVSSKLELLIRREQAALRKESDAKRMFEELHSREAKIKEFEEAKKDPKKALEMLGLTLDQFAQTQLNDGKIPPEVEIAALRKELEAFKNQTKEEKESEKERELAAQKQSAEAREREEINKFKGTISQYVKDNAGRYEFIGFDEAQDLVYDVIDEQYNRTYAAALKEFEASGLEPDPNKPIVGKVMDIKEAADKVEEWLEGKYNKAKELSKIKALWGAVPKTAQDKFMKQELPKTAPPKTLTNQLSAQPPLPKTEPREITDQERVQKALAYARQRGIRV